MCVYFYASVGEGGGEHQKYLKFKGGGDSNIDPGPPADK